MEEIVELKPLLKRLRMSGVLEDLEATFQDAMERKWSHSQLLAHLFSREADRRDHKKYCYRLSRSKLDPRKTFETYDFTFNMNVSESVMRELARCEFMDKQQNILLVGPAGVGKTHIANAIGQEACRKGRIVLMDRASEMLKWLHAGGGDGSFVKRMETLMEAELLILDDFGLIPLPPQHQISLYEIICARYEKVSTIITSNRDFGEWLGVFENPLLGSAVMDRLVHKAIKLTVKGESYRCFSFSATQKEVLEKVADQPEGG
jgi:DNA replication protein DnaC